MSLFEETFEIAVFILGFRRRPVLLIPRCLQSQQDCVVRPLGGRQRYCASSDINPADSLCRMAQKVQTERAEKSPCLCLPRSLLCHSVQRICFNSINNYSVKFSETQLLYSHLLVFILLTKICLSHCLSILYSSCNEYEEICPPPGLD